MKVRLMAAILMAAALAAPLVPTVTAVHAGPAPATKAVSPIFRPLLPALVRTKVPIHLPTVFPEAGGHQLYATMGTAKPGRYAIVVDYTADCHGANACHYGDIEGRAAVAGKPAGLPVQLGHKATGYFLLGHCGASCAESTITWDAGHFRYSAGAKVSRADLIAFAASAVN